ncbi:MAG: hypothetical protein L6R36_009195 [Xanthoria steineri]|nr:MAG: hypothetical protein L6R36_009195 [Xanthoria steineri]
MPSNTQSQGATLATPLTPSRERSQRTKKPSSRQEFVAQQEQQNKQSRQREKEDDHLLRAAIGDAPPNSKRARELRAKFYEKEAERTELARRIREEDTRKKEKWEAEVAQFGEEEAKRRRRLARQLRQEEDALTTSDIEVIQEEERADNPELTYAVFVKLNSKLLWKGQYPKGHLQDFDIYEFEQFFWDTVDLQPGWKPGSKATKIMVSCRAKDSRSIWEYQQISEFSTEERDKVDAVIVNQATDWKYELKVRLEVFFESPKPDISKHLIPTNREVTRKRSQAEISSDPPQAADEDGGCYSPSYRPSYEKTEDPTDHARWAEAILFSGSL